MGRNWNGAMPPLLENPCDWCDGWGGSHKQYDAELPWGECSKCRGTGRFPPLGPKQPPSPAERYQPEYDD